MRWRAPDSAIALAALLLACSRDASHPPAPPTGDDAGAQGCNPGELTLDDGTCQPAGIPPEMCGVGFKPDGNMGCDPILPPQPCPKGQMAVPGETQCRDVAPCADGTWGDIPVDANTQFVEASYAGGGSDGSQGRPWTKIGDAVNAAAPGAIVAIAAGSYSEDVTIESKTVRLWGRCPRLVEIVGTGSGPALGPVDIREGATGTQVHDLAVRGAGSFGIGLSGSRNVVADRVWVHDTADRGINLQGTLGATDGTISRSLVEAATGAGVVIVGVEATIDSSVVRGTQPVTGANGSGQGIDVEDDADTRARARVTARSCVVESNRASGVIVSGSDFSMDQSVVRDTQAQAGDGQLGRGVGVQDDTQTRARASAKIRASVIERNRAEGIFVGGSDASVEGTVVRDTKPRASDGQFGRGVSVQDSAATHNRSRATLRACTVVRNFEIGVFAGGSDATLEATIVSDTRPRPGDHHAGLGVSVQDHPPVGASLVVRACVVERNHETGISVLGSTATIEASLVGDTGARQDGTFGDGIIVESHVVGGSAASATVTRSRVDSSARAGIANFGAPVSVDTTAFDCNTFDLDGEEEHGMAYEFDQSAGGNVCECGADAGTCQALSSGLSPPEPVSPAQ